MLSHELRNPLAAFLNATNVVRLSCSDRPGVSSAVGVLERQGRHMARLLDDLLDVSRIANGKFELRRETTNLVDAIEAAIESVQSSVERAGVIVEKRFAPEGLTVNGDPARLQQVATNLLTNAIRHSKRGGRVLIDAHEEGGSVLLRVEDEGDGIAPGLLPQVFEMFVQLGEQAHKKGGGLGVGLTLVKNIVERHGGTVEATSDGEHKGACFTVRIPRGDGLVAEATAESKREPRSRRIVLVEDQADTREMMRMLLEERGHSVEEAGDGSEGVEVIRRVKPDVALVDLGLPTLNGFEVAREVRRFDGMHHVFMVALSGYGSEADIGNARAAGFDTHLTKPADCNRLFRLIERLQPD
jgi:two-component system CheB/CheR fusion protein